MNKNLIGFAFAMISNTRKLFLVEKEIEIIIEEERKTHESTLEIMQVSERKRMSLQAEVDELRSLLDAVTISFLWNSC